MADGKGQDEGGKLLYCSFCGKNQNEVRKLIAGPSVYICDECVDLCNDIIREEVLEADAESDEERLPTPAKYVIHWTTTSSDKTAPRWCCL
ncbi:hypothetical protein HAALTHF_36240n [Vreelandella aquamarina]|nr:hypothetical protein HAALTHF_36240n [Halomonas axialensis]